MALLKTQTHCLASLAKEIRGVEKDLVTRLAEKTTLWTYIFFLRSCKYRFIQALGASL
jgi:hypothetical protein